MRYLLRPFSNTSRDQDTSSCSVRSITRGFFPVNAYTVEYVRDLAHGKGNRCRPLADCSRPTICRKGLDRNYGSELPYSFQVFLRIRRRSCAITE